MTVCFHQALIHCAAIKVLLVSFANSHSCSLQHKMKISVLLDHSYRNTPIYAIHANRGRRSLKKIIATCKCSSSCNVTQASLVGPVAVVPGYVTLRDAAFIFNTHSHTHKPCFESQRDLEMKLMPSKKRL